MCAAYSASSDVSPSYDKCSWMFGNPGQPSDGADGQCFSGSTHGPHSQASLGRGKSSNNLHLLRSVDHGCFRKLMNRFAAVWCPVQNTRTKRSDIIGVFVNKITHIYHLSDIIFQERVNMVFSERETTMFLPPSHMRRHDRAFSTTAGWYVSTPPRS
jgi:hypothetical protein